MGLYDMLGLGQAQAPQPSGLAGLFSGIAAGYVPDSGYFGQQAAAHSTAEQAKHDMLMAQMMAQQQEAPPSQWFMSEFQHRKVKHVESREVTCMEVATKQITGAVRAVDDAQQAVVDAQEKN